MGADTGADRRHGAGFTDLPIGLLEFPLPKQGYKCWYIIMDWTTGDASRLFTLEATIGLKYGCFFIKTKGHFLKVMDPFFRR